MTSATTRLSRVSAAIGVAFALSTSPAAAGGYIKLGDIKGESAAKGQGGQIEIESWSWGETQSARKGNVEYGWKVEEGEKAARGDMVLKGSKIGENAPAGDPDRPLVAGRVPDPAVEREMKESGEKGGTEDINIGVGELQEATVSKRIDKSSPKLMQALAAPLPRGSVRVKVKMPWPACQEGKFYPKLIVGSPVKVYTLSGVTVASCGGGGSLPMEEISFNYAKITTGPATQGKQAPKSTVRGWDPEKKQE